jgi:hypothetical protein
LLLVIRLKRTPRHHRIEFHTRSGEPAGQFSIGTYLVAMGQQGVQGLVNGYRNGLGLLLKPLAAAEIARLKIAEAANGGRAGGCRLQYGIRVTSAVYLGSRR